ncbi:MAG: protein kinase family protein [Alphaproteobacteria bacterium]|nr:protein kinase family protein [Alphaproteobacteria bacterium]
MKRMHTLDSRNKTYNSCQKVLSGLTDQQLNNLMKNAESFHTSMWSTSSLLSLNDTKIFVKKIPLTDLERLPDNFQSTANLFNLPAYYQYGVGSAGFGAWRELASHLMTTDWVLSGKCLDFPILYHWRVVPCDKPEPMNDEESERFERDVAYWEGSVAVRDRLLSSHNASAHIVLFLEHIPQNLYQWLSAELIAGENVEAAIEMVVNALKVTTDFMISQDFIHFDAHFENILTDGNQLYFSDFGLSLSKKFDLSSEELAFFENHRTYDRCSTLVNLLHCFMTYKYERSQWKNVHLHEYLMGRYGEILQAIVPIVDRCASIALIMAEFYDSLIKKSKSTPYPKDKLEELLVELG